MSSVDRRVTLRLLGGGLLGGAIIAANPDISLLASLAPAEPVKDTAPQNRGSILAPRLAQAATLAAHQESNILSNRLAVVSGAAPETKVELRENEKPARINFELRVIALGTATAENTYYRIQGNDENTYYLYKATYNQPAKFDSAGNPLKYDAFSRNTEAVAEFTRTSLKDDKGNDVWKKEELKQPTVVIESKPNDDSCQSECQKTTIFLQEVDSAGNPIEGARKGAFREIKFERDKECYEIAGWYFNHEAPPPPTPSPSPLPSPSPAPKSSPQALPGTGNDFDPSQQVDIRTTKPQWGQP